MTYSIPMRDCRPVEMHGDLACSPVTPASQAGYDKNGIPLTARAQWLVGLRKSRALRPNGNYLLAPTVDPNTGEVILPDILPWSARLGRERATPGSRRYDE